jgi:DNA-binding transcriptional regulator YiaG
MGDINKMFSQLLKDAELTQTAFAHKIGVKPGTVSEWRGDAPRYATAYLELFIQHQQAEATRQQVREWLL